MVKKVWKLLDFEPRASDINNVEGESLLSLGSFLAPSTQPEHRPLILWPFPYVLTLIATGKSFHVLAPIYFGLRKNRILDTARKILILQLNQAEDDSTPDEIVIHFNKQHASAGKIHLSPPSGESPLGAIHLFLSSSNLPYLIDWLTPRTHRGKPIENLPPRL